MSAQIRTEANSYKVMTTTDTMHITTLQGKEGSRVFAFYFNHTLYIKKVLTVIIEQLKIFLSSPNALFIMVSPYTPQP